MRIKYKTIVFAMVLWSTQISYGQFILELDTPTVEAKIFAPKIISTQLTERDFTISPDGTEIYYTVLNGLFNGNIFFIKKTGEQWSAPALVSFSGQSKDLEPAFADEGKKLYFASKRGGSDFDIWYVERDNANDAWSSPIDVGSPINTSTNEFYPSVANDGSLYYTAKYSHGKGGEDIWYAKFLDGEYQTPVALDGVNTANDEFNAFVAPDESYIYFGSFGRSGGFGGGDIYKSTRSNAGVWGNGSNLGSRVNTSSLDYSPYVSPDGRYLFFTSQRWARPTEISDNPFDPKAVVDSFITPNGEGSDIYWIRR
jgi:Tol biopolymer transport system component